MVELYLHSPIRFHGVVFNLLVKYRDRSMLGKYEHSSDKCEGIYKWGPENKIAITSNTDETI
jgi:hypothetical protein